MAMKMIIADEVNDSLIADVLKSGAINTASIYTNYFVNSATAASAVVLAPVILYSALVQGSAAKGQLLIGDATAVASVTNDTSASLVAKLDLAARGIYIFDTYLSSGLTYRLTGLNCDGITLTYQLA